MAGLLALTLAVEGRLTIPNTNHPEMCDCSESAALPAVPNGLAAVPDPPVPPG